MTCEGFFCSGIVSLAAVSLLVSLFGALEIKKGRYVRVRRVRLADDPKTRWSSLTVKAPHRPISRLWVADNPIDANAIVSPSFTFALRPGR
jgi:hypothetical protein